jgi:hypothetical protein
MAETVQGRELARVEQANGYRLGDMLILRIAGEKPSPCFEVDIEELPIRIFPPEFAATWAPDPLAICPDVMTPYVRVEAFRLGGQADQVKLHTAGGNIDVAIETIPPPDGDVAAAAADDPRAAAEPIEAVGYSDDWDFGAAMKDAIAQLPDRSGGARDWLSTYQVVAVGAEIGGIAGFNRLAVKVRG